MYDQNLKFKSGKPERGGVRSEEEETTDRHDRHDRTSEGLPQVKLLTNGSGKVWTVDENGKPLGNTTDNSAIRTQQGFQAIKERFKLLDSARKILDGERTQHCFYNRVDKNDGVGVTFNKFRNKANYTNVMRCANAWGCPVCAAIISEHRKCEVKDAMDWWKKQGGSVLLLTLTVPHYSDTDIKQLKKDLKKAYGKFFKGVRASKDMFERWQIKHYISCFEITRLKWLSSSLSRFVICALFLGQTIITWYQARYVQGLERLLFKIRSGRTKRKTRIRFTSWK